MRACAARAAPVAGALTLALACLGSSAGSAGAEAQSSAYRVRALCPAPTPGYYDCLGLRLAAQQPLSLPGATRAKPAPSDAPAASSPATQGQSEGEEPAEGAAGQGSTAGATGAGSTEGAASEGPAAGASRIEYTQPWGGSLSPQNVLGAYGLATAHAPASQQTLALVDAYDDPGAEHDLQVFDEQFGLPACTSANGCFTEVKLHSPAVNPSWALEIATDIEVAHGLCSSCKILLIEAPSNRNAKLEEAEHTAELRGAQEISDSWGGPEAGITAGKDSAGAFDHPGTVITAAAGDYGYLDWDEEESIERGFADYPASSPHVVAVGGTRLALGTGGAWSGESVWNGDGAGGGGCSTVLGAPAWQQSLPDWSAVGCESHRAVADIAADADPYTGVAVYDSTPIREGENEYLGWEKLGGTSVASPIIAAAFALAGGAALQEGGTPVEYPARTLYENVAANSWSLHDVTSGSNGACARGFSLQTGESECSAGEEAASCAERAICIAGSGYDGPSGVGTPAALAAFKAPAIAAQERPSEAPAGATSEPGGGSHAAGGSGSGQPVGGSTAAAQAQQGETSTASGKSRAAHTRAVSPSISALALTRSALAALTRRRSAPSRLWFTFKLNIEATLRVRLAVRVVKHGHGGWRNLPVGATIAGSPGSDTAHLGLARELAPGRYRLTLTPARGHARSLVFRAR